MESSIASMRFFLSECDASIRAEWHDRLNRYAQNPLDEKYRENSQADASNYARELYMLYSRCFRGVKTEAGV